MSAIDRCIAQIHSVRSVAVGVEPAYVARSRLGRLTVTCASIVARLIGTPAPSLPGPIRVQGNVSPVARQLSDSCNQIYILSRHLSQPSEPLDERWIRGWRGLINELDKLEACVEKCRQGGTACQ